MIKIKQTVEIDRELVDCFRYLADFSTCEQWDPAVYRAHKRTAGRPGVGSEFDVTVSLFGRRTTLYYRIEAFAAGARLELRGAGAGMVSNERFELHAVDDGRTRIDYRAEFRLDGWRRAGQRAAGALLKRMIRHAATGLKRALEIDATPPAQGWLSYTADRSVLLALPSFTERGYLALDNKSHSEFMDESIVIVTGATRGIGLAAACEYARLGAHVALIGRDAARLDDATRAVRDFAGCQASHIAGFQADLLDLAQVRALAGRLAHAYPRIDVLLNNAGALFDTREQTADGFERTLAVNLVAPFVLTEALLEPLTAGSARVIDMSSGGMYTQPLQLDDLNYTRDAYDGAKAYARAKRALVALTRHWAHRYNERGLRFNAMHPGWVATPGVAKSLPGFNRVMRRALREPRMGADTAVWLGSARAAADFNGAFFFDRKPHPTAVLPNTAVRPSEAQRLYAWLRNATDRDAHGVG